MNESMNERKLGSGPERATGWEGAYNEFSARNVEKSNSQVDKKRQNGGSNFSVLFDGYS